MKKTLLGAAAALTLLVACGGVDRAGTRDNIVKGLKSSGINIDSKCVDDALNKYSDDELKAIDKQLGKSDTSGQAGEFLVAVQGCIIAS